MSENKDYNLIVDRLHNIKQIVDGKNIDSIINFTDTFDTLVYPNVNDVRYLLPKNI
jgi:hypothetical protein